MGIFNADIIINIPPAFFSLQKSGLVRVYLTSVFLLLSVPRCFGDQKPQFDCEDEVFKVTRVEGVRGEGEEKEFLVKWKGYRERTWEKEVYLKGAEQRVREFFRRKRRNKKRRERRAE